MKSNTASANSSKASGRPFLSNEPCDDLLWGLFIVNRIFIILGFIRIFYDIVRITYDVSKQVLCIKDIQKTLYTAFNFILAGNFATCSNILDMFKS